MPRSSQLPEKCGFGWLMTASSLNAQNVPGGQPIATSPHLESQKLGVLCEVLQGRNRVAKEDDTDPEFKVIRAEDIRSTLTPWSDLPLSNGRKASSIAVSAGDIIGSISGPYGRWVVVPPGYGPALASDHTVVLRKRTDLSMWYLLEFLRSDRGRDLLKTTVRGGFISRIAPGELKQILVPDCPLGTSYVDSILSMFEEDHSRVGRGINELRGRLNEIYEGTNTAEVSASLDAVQGIAASMNVMGNLSDIMWIAKTSYPYPVARTLRAIGRTVLQRERYHEVVHEASESLSALLACLCIAVARASDIPRGRAARSWLSETGRNGATIGRRYSMIFEIAKDLIPASGDQESFGGLGRALGDTNAPAVSLMRALLKERNRIHGDYPRTDTQFRNRLEKAEPQLRQLLEALGFLARWEINYAESVEPVEDERRSTKFQATFRILRGDNPDWDVSKRTFTEPLYRGRVYAFVDSRDLIELYPYLLVQDCEVCGAAEVYYPSSFNTEEIHLKSIDRGHAQVSRDRVLLRAVQLAFCNS